MWLLYKKLIVYLLYRFQANHNKDYSVVKTFRMGLRPRPFFVSPSIKIYSFRNFVYCIEIFGENYYICSIIGLLL